MDQLDTMTHRGACRYGEVGLDVDAHPQVLARGCKCKKCFPHVPESEYVAYHMRERHGDD